MNEFSFSYKSIFKFFPLLAIMSLGGCSDTLEVSEPAPLKANFSVINYNIFYEIDVDKRLFGSSQSIRLTPINTTNKFVFEILSAVDITLVNLIESNGNEIEIKSWKSIEEIEYSRGEESDVFSRIEVQLEREIIADISLEFLIAYTFQLSDASSSSVKELLKFQVARDGGRALHPTNGTFPYFGANISAPLHIEFRHPANLLCAVPGNRKSTTSDGKYIQEIFESTIPAIPVFYVGKGDLITRSKDDITIEYLLAEGQVFEENVADKTFEMVQLLNQSFGSPVNTDYRFSFISLPSSSITGESKGNSIYFAYRNPSDFLWDKESKIEFLSLIGHELFHNWNLWQTQWQGNYYEWFVEGGAGFISSWVCESLLESEAGSAVRKRFVDGYTENKGYNAQRTLVSAGKSNKEERSLIYSYGALVWEQLRRNLGNKDFFASLSHFFKYKNNPVGYDDLMASFNEQSNENVKGFLSQWLSHNAKIDLKINKVSTQILGDAIETEVIIEVDSDKDYEINTSLGYKSSGDPKLTLIDLVLSKKGTKTIKFLSQNPPTYIALDPEVTVPQVNFNNNIWFE